MTLLQMNMFCGSSSVGRASAFQAGCREFESRLPLHRESIALALYFYARVRHTRTRNSCSCCSQLFEFYPQGVGISVKARAARLR